MVTIWLPAAEFRAGDIVVNNRPRDAESLNGRFELLEDIDQRLLRQNGAWNCYQKWIARKFRGRLRKP